MMEPVKFSIVGIGGYAATYARALDALEQEGLAVTHSVTTRNPAKYAERVAAYEERGTLIRADLDELLELDAAEIDVLGVPCGISQHRRMVIAGADAGCHVMVEKPPAATIQDTDAMLAALARSGRRCQVGFQSQSNKKIRGLKRRICDGRLGVIRSVTVRAMKPSSTSRFTNPEKPWYGKLKMGETYVLDGSVNNPYAHYLMNAMYFASPEWQTLAQPVTVRGEMYKGNDIQSEDTCAIEVACANGVTVRFFATLCPEGRLSPEIEVVGEKGVAQAPSVGDVVIRYNDGSSETLEQGDQSPNVEQFRNLARHLRGEEDELNCPLEMTRPFTLAVNGAFESSGGTHKIPESALERPPDGQGGNRVEITGIDAIIERAFTERKLFSDLGVPWAVATQPFSVENYTRFDMPDQG